MEDQVNIQIEKNVPLPTRTIYPWAEMKIGDSFVCELTLNQRAGMCANAKNAGIKVATRKGGDKFRIWRIE